MRVVEVTLGRLPVYHAQQVPLVSKRSNATHRLQSAVAGNRFKPAEGVRDNVFPLPLKRLESP